MATTRDGVPKIFFKLADQARSGDALSTDMLAKLMNTPQYEETFLPEVIDLIGADAFLDLVRILGGRTVTVPTVNDVLSVTNRRR